MRRVITRAMSDRASERYADAGAMLADLGVSSAASTGTATVMIEGKKDSSKTQVLPDSQPVKQEPVPGEAPAKSNKNLIRGGIIAACVVVLVLVTVGLLNLRPKGAEERTGVPDEKELAVISDEPKEGVSDKEEETASAEEEIQTEQQEVPQASNQADNTAAEQVGAEKVEPEQPQPEAPVNPNREEINGLTVNWGSGVTAAQKEVLRRLVNNMVYVQGGTFMMGAQDSDSEAFGDEKPQHQVTLSSYRIGKFEVTQKEWETVTGENNSHSRGENLPVERVYKGDCQRFINRLNQMTGLGFHLPTEAQWEYAARGGTRSNGYKYSGSNDINEVAWFSENSGGHTHPVGQKGANELGLYDMSGNVLEWCSDFYKSYNSEAVINPTGPSTGNHCVSRGGGFDNRDRSSRVTTRPFVLPDTRGTNLGLRLAL